jgi:hypothetical protein
MASDRGAPSWHLDDASIIAAANPYTFYKPSSQAIALLRAGNAVKLIFAFESENARAPRAERMWVRIERVEAGRYAGKLENDPRYIKDLKYGDLVEFEARHVIRWTSMIPFPIPRSRIGRDAMSRTGFSTTAFALATFTGNRPTGTTIRAGA